MLEGKQGCETGEEKKADNHQEDDKANHCIW